MVRHRAIQRNKLLMGMLGAVASGLAATALASPATANASCASIAGIGNGGGCTSTWSKFQQFEKCCMCGDVSKNGLYIRVNPTTVPHPTLEKNAE